MQRAKFKRIITITGIAGATLHCASQSLKPGLHISRKDRKHLFANMFFKLSRYGLDSISFG